MITCVCLSCGKNFYVTESDKVRKYCPKCKGCTVGTGRKVKVIETTCAYCGKPLVRKCYERSFYAAHYCDNHCRYTHAKEVKAAKADERGLQSARFIACRVGVPCTYRLGDALTVDAVSALPDGAVYRASGKIVFVQDGAHLAKLEARLPG